MKGYRYVITNPEGLHARIAVNLAKICRDAEGRIVVSAGDRKADGKEVFAVMNLYAVKGDELVFLERVETRRKSCGRFRSFAFHSFSSQS